MLFAKLQPMLALKKDEPFDDPDYIFEPKIDGIRLLLHADLAAGKVQLYTKRGVDCTQQYPEFQDLALSGVQSVILDGELAIATNGKPDFTKVMRRFSAGQSKAQALAAAMPATMVAFDVLYLNGERLTGLLLIQRKQILDEIVPDSGPVIRSLYVERDGTLLFDQMVARELEGIIAKPKLSKYHPGQRRDWLKVKNYRRGEFEVLGYIPATGQLLVGKDGVPLAQAFGLNPVDREAFVRLLPEIGTDKKEDALFIKKSLRCKAKYTVGAQGNVRDCVFEGWIT